MFTPIIKKLSGDNLLTQKGNVLDLGFGGGKEVLALAELDFTVDAVDVNAESGTELKKVLSEKNLIDQVHIYNEKIEDFDIKKDTYDCIIASNSLPFISEKEKVITVIEKIADGLKQNGCMYITLFGTKDGWADKKTMSFFEYAEAKEIIDNLPVTFYFSEIEEGYGKTMKGDIKYWNVFRFIYIKK